MSDKDDIWSYLANQSEIAEYHVIGSEGWGRYEHPTSFRSYLHLADIFSTKCQFIKIGKVVDYRDKHLELKRLRSGCICFYSLNFAFETKNIELLVALQQCLQVPPGTKLVPQITKYVGSKKDAVEDMDMYFKQYNNHVTINGVHFVILHQHDLPYVRQFYRNINMNWVDHHYETWEKIRPSNLVSDDE